MYIKAMGNAASPKAMQQLKRILKDRTQALHTRVECVWAHRRIIREARETVSNLRPQDRTLVTNILGLQTVRVQRSVNVYISIMVLTYITFEEIVKYVALIFETRSYRVGSF